MEPPSIPQRQFTRRIRELPGPSTAWRGAGAVLVGITVGMATFAATISEAAPISKSALAWIAAGLCFAMALLCFLSHWDVNRGRKRKTIEIVDEDATNL
jgi:uncharacterized membrane protein